MGTLLFVTLLVAIIIFVYTKFDFSDKSQYQPTKHEEELLDYFNDIVLKSEYFDQSERVVKWMEPMKLFISKEKVYDRQMTAVKKAINYINSLATDGFRIELVEDISKSNAILFLCDKSRIKVLAPDFYKTLEAVQMKEDFCGLTSILFSETSYAIWKVMIFVDIDETIQMQENAILEEISHGVGISSDSDKYPNSVFYENKFLEKIITLEYSKMDADVIRLLYHPGMKPGLRINQVKRIIMHILRSETENRQK